MKRNTRNLRKIVTLALFVLLLAALPISMVFAATSGPNDAGAGADVADVGTIPWSTPGNITAAGSPYATATITPSGTTHYLQGTSYGFAIPTDATINGITVVIRRQSTGIIPPFARDSVVRLVKGGAVTGDNKAVVGTNWPNGSFGTQTYGGASDLWGTTWTPAEINAADFGVVLSATNPQVVNRTASVDYMRITVEFTLPTPTLSVTNSPVTYNGSPQAAVVEGSVAGTVSNVLYDGSATVPTDAGTYAVTADFTPDNPDYASLTGASAGDFVIEQATPTLSVTNSPVTYTGAPQAAAVASSVAGTVSNVLYDGSATVPTDAGTYAVTADFAPDDAANYESLMGASAGDFVIEQATPTLSVTNSPVTYTGAPQAAAVAGSAPGTVSNILYDGSATVPTDAGTYAVTADFAPDDTANYESLMGAVAGDFVIEQATPTLSVTNSPVIYTGLPQAAVVEGSVAGTVSNVLYNGSATVPTDAGTYAVTADFAPDDAANYESLTGASAGDFVIHGVTPTLSVTNSPVTYNGFPQAAVVEGSVPGTVSNVLYDGSATVPTDVGTYAVTADFVPDDPSFESLTGASAGDFVIEQATPTVSVTNSPVSFTGLPQAAEVDGSVPGTVSNVLYNGSATVPSLPGTYAVTVDFTPADATNYEALTGAPAGDFVILGSWIYFPIMSHNGIVP